MANTIAARSSDSSPPPSPAPPGRHEAGTEPWLALSFLLTGYLLVFAAVTMVNVALPAAQEDLGLSDAGRQWILTSYSLAFGGLMLLGGRLGDALGLRRAVTLGLVGFAAASLLGGAANSGGLLLTARALQGVAGAVVAPAGLALLSVMFPAGPARARAFAVLGMVMGLGTAGSFIVAGWLTDAASWRWCFLVIAPIAAVAAIGLRRTAPAAIREDRLRPDVVSAVTITGGVTALVLGFDQAARHGWGRPWTLVLIAVGAALLAAFVIGAQRMRSPLVPLEVIVHRTRGAAYLAVFVLAIGMFAGLYFLTVYLQTVLGYSALRTGVAFLPFGLSAMAASRALARWTGRVRIGPMLAAGLVAIAAGIALVTRLTTTSAYTTGVLPTMLLLGVGGTVVMVTASNTATASAGPDAGIASAAVGATQQIGAALGTALLGSIAAAATEHRFGRPRPATSNGAWLEAVVHGFTQAAAVGAIIVVIGSVGVLAVARRAT